MAYLSNGEEYLENLIANEITDMHNPKCVNCNECCTVTAIITQEEFDNIKRYLNDNAKGRKLYKQAIETIMKYKEQGIIYLMCPFSNETTKRCEIYFIRPSVCREFHCDPSRYNLKPNPDRKRTIGELIIPYREVNP